MAAARRRGRQAVTLAERYGLEEHPILAPALGAVGAMAVWTGDFDEGERWLRRAWEVAEENADPAATVLLHVATGMLHAGRWQHQPALDGFAAAARAQLLLSGAHALAPRICGWLASAQARLGRVDEARATLAGFSTDLERMGAIHNGRAVVHLADGDPASALGELGDAQDPSQPAFTVVEAHLLAGIAHLALDDRSAAVAAAEAALAAAEPDRLIFPFAMTGAAELLESGHPVLLESFLDGPEV